MNFLAVVLLAAFAAAQQPQRPVIPETFETYYNITVEGRGGHNIEGSGRWYSDSETKQELEVTDYGHSSEERMRVFRLERFDLQKEYIIYGSETHCEEHDLPVFHAPFNFTKEAEYRGKKTYMDKTLDIWGVKHDEFELELAVFEENPDMPVFLERKEMGSTSMLHFNKFASTKPPSTSFSIPASCQK